MRNYFNILEMKRGAAGPVLFGPCFLSSDELEYLESDAADIEETLVQFTVKVKKPRINVENFDSVDVDGESESGEAGELPHGLSAMNGEISIEPFVFSPPPIFRNSSEFLLPKGRKLRFYEKLFPLDQQTLFGKIFDHLEEASPSADEKRATEKITVVGLSIPKLKKKIQKDLPEIWK